MTAAVQLHRTERLEGRLRAPGDKSISHRAVLLGALADGISTIEGLSRGADVVATLDAVRALGVRVHDDGDLVVLESGGVLHPSGTPLDCGNSGTSMRLLSGVVAAVEGTHHLFGDASLSRRPMDRVAVPLSQMGASVEGVGERCLPPLVIRGGQLKGITYTVPVPSAQVKSAVLLAGLRADGPTMVLETTPTRQHTEEMLRRAGAELHHESVGSATAWHLRPGPLRPIDWEVPGDPSQAAFFIVAAILSTEGSLTVTDLYSGPQRSGFLEVLGRMGAALEFHHHEGSFDVVARPSTLRGTTVQAAEIPSLDEVPILAVAAARAHGRTVFHDVGELRVKESDRLAATAALVEAIGATATVVGDDLVIEGSAHGGGDFDLDPDGDHRLAMAAAVAALSAAPGVVGTISAPSCIKTSYPSFFRDLQSVGVAVVDVLE